MLPYLLIWKYTRLLLGKQETSAITEWFYPAASKQMNPVPTRNLRKNLEESISNQMLLMVTAADDQIL